MTGFAAGSGERAAGAPRERVGLGSRPPLPTRLLRGPLERLVARRRPGARIARIARSPAPRRSSWWLEELAVTLRDGTVLDVVFKDLGRATPGSGADRAKPRLVVDPGREPWVYARVLEPLRGDPLRGGPDASARGARASGPDLPSGGPPALWGWVSDGGIGRHWLFLERVDGSPLAESGEAGAWRDAAAWLARFHTAVRRRRSPPGPLIRHDRRLHGRWFRRALAMARDRAGRGGAGRGRETVDALEAIRATHAAAAAEIAAAPGTPIHGEFYPSNVLVEERWGVRRIRPVDWEMAGLGPPLMDLAALTSGGWDPKERAGMILAYRNAVLEAGATLEPMDRFLRTLTACRLLLAVQWLGWSAAWAPPPEHRQDWLDEAVRSAEELEES